MNHQRTGKEPNEGMCKSTPVRMNASKFYYPFGKSKNDGPIGGSFHEALSESFIEWVDERRIRRDAVQYNTAHCNTTQYNNAVYCNILEYNVML